MQVQDSDTAHVRLLQSALRDVLQVKPIILETAVATPLMLRYALLRKALSTNGVITNSVRVRSP